MTVPHAPTFAHALQQVDHIYTGTTEAVQAHLETLGHTSQSAEALREAHYTGRDDLYQLIRALQESVQDEVNVLRQAFVDIHLGRIAMGEPTPPKDPTHAALHRRGAIQTEDGECGLRAAMTHLEELLET